MGRKLLYFFVLAALTGCNALRPSLMMRTPKDYKFDSLPKNPILEYRIAQNDVVDFRMYSNNGFKLIDISPMLGTTNLNQINQSFQYLVEYDGTVKLPVIGRVKLQGMTLREAESFLEQKYDSIYRDPYILLKVTNKRVIIFPGADGQAKVVPLSNENVTLVEALALAGGIYTDGKAKTIKLIRGDPKNPQVFLIDLSTINGMRAGDVVLQNNDIVYVESRPRIANRIFTEIAPYISFITSMILFYELIKRSK